MPRFRVSYTLYSDIDATPLDSGVTHVTAGDADEAARAVADKVHATHPAADERVHPRVEIDEVLAVETDSIWVLLYVTSGHHQFELFYDLEDAKKRAEEIVRQEEPEDSFRWNDRSESEWELNGDDYGTFLTITRMEIQ